MFEMSPCGCGSSPRRRARRKKNTRINELGSERRVMGDVISRIANFLGFYQVSVYTIYIYQPLRIMFTYFAVWFSLSTNTRTV